MDQETVFKLLTDEEYAKMFTAFKKASDEDAVIRNAIITPIIGKFRNKSLDFMSVGAGTGWLEDEIIKHPALSINSILAIEPNPEHAEKLRETSKSWIDTIYNIDNSYFNEHYQTDMKFDVILLIHSIYYFENPIDVIIKLRSFLKPGGQIMIAVIGERGGHELAAQLHTKLNSAASTFSYNWMSSEFLVNRLNETNITFQCQNRTARNDVTDFIERKDTPSCNDTISFFLHTKYEDLDKTLQEDIYNIVQDCATVTKDNKYFFPEDTTYITIQSY